MHPAKNQNQKKKRKMKMKMKMKTRMEEKEKIFVQAYGRTSEFYEIDMANGCVKKLPHLLKLCLNSITSIGSVIYAVGGVPPDMMNGIKEMVYRTYMYYLDTDSGSDSDSGGWKEIPPYIPPADSYVPVSPIPNIPFCIPTAVSFGGKVYVFASFEKSRSAVVFNSNTNQWETLRPPSDVGFFDISSPASAVADPDNNRLLVSFTTIASLYAYYPSDNTWELLSDSFKCAAAKLVFVNGVFYAYLPKYPDLLMAFDTVTNQLLEIESTAEIPDKIWRYKYADMLYLGNGLMCLVKSCSTEPPRTDISIAKFRIKRCIDRPAVLIITPLPVETYTINTHCSIKNYYPF